MCYRSIGTSYWESGRGDWIRTSDPLRPRQVRYQAALHPDPSPSYRHSKNHAGSLFTVCVKRLPASYSPYTVRMPGDTKHDRRIAQLRIVLTAAALGVAAI